MGLHVQLDLKAIEQAPLVARAAGITLSQQLSGLALLYHHVWAHKTLTVPSSVLLGCFEVPPSGLERLIDAEVTFGHLARQNDGVWRVRGAKRYQALRGKLAEGGRKAKGNLRQFTGGEPQRGPSSPPLAEKPEKPAAPAGRGTKASSGPRTTSAEEDCFTVLESIRIEHCERLGLEPGKSTRPAPRALNARLAGAVEKVGIVDTIANGQPFTRWDYLTLLFEQYLLDDFGRVDKEGNARQPPWPIELFLAPGVLKRFKANYEQGDEAAG